MANVGAFTRSVTACGEGMEDLLSKGRALLQRWSGEPVVAMVPEESPALVYANQHLETLATLRGQLREVQHALARDEALWARLKINDITPETDAERHAVGPRILTLRTEVARLLREDATLVQRIAEIDAQAQAYAALTAETRAWLEPLLDRLPSDAELERVFTVSRQLDGMARDLLTATNDRQFRRPACDPHARVRERLERCVQVLSRLHLMRHLSHMKDKTAAS